MAISASLDTSPRSRKTANVMQSIGKIDLDEYRASSAEDMANRAIHADTVAEFLDGLLQYPLNDEDPLRPTLVTNPFEGLKDADRWDENLVTEKLVAAIAAHDLAPGFAFHRSENMADSPEIDNTGQKVDGGFFRQEDVPSAANPDWANQRGPVELKSRKEGNKKDPYHDGKPDGTADADAESRTKVRGQLISYTEIIYRVQHRHALFMLLIIGRRFRLLRWDRAGTIITKATDYYEHPDVLCDFPWRISHLPDDKLGIDTSAVRIRPADILFDRMDLASVGPRREDAIHKERLLGEENITDATTFRYVRDMFAESIEGKWPRYSLRVRDGDHDRYFAVGRPVFVEKGMACRGVRGYVAWEYSADGPTRFVWLKDTWRAAYDGMKREGDILLLLKAAEIQNVPTLVCHGDVEDQTTITAAWWKRKNPASSASPPTCVYRNANSKVGRMKRKRDPLAHSCVNPSGPQGPDEGPKLSFRVDCPLRIHKHYRLVVAEVCMPLESFQDGKQLVSLVLDCLRTHSDAVRNSALQLLHCDISDSNILIYPKVRTTDDGKRFLKWTGILADWEVSKPIAKENVKTMARQPERTGSWQFLSVNLLSNPARPIRVPDELESLLHVLIYYAVRYLQSNMTSDEVATFIDDFFDCFTVTKERGVLCGSKKSSTMRVDANLQFLPSTGGYVRVLFHSPLDFLFPLILSWFKAHYKVIDYAARHGQPGTSAPAIGAAPTPSNSQMPASVAQTGGTPPADEMDAEELEWNAMRSQKPTELDEPTDEEEKKARQVQVHKHMIKLLQLAHDDPGWPEKDRDQAGDRVPKGWRSPRQPIPPSVLGMRPPAVDDRGGHGEPLSRKPGVEKTKKSSAKRVRRS